MNKVLVVVAVLVGLLGVMAVSGFAQAAPRSDAWVPGLASFLIPGLGQLLNGQMDKAIIHFGVAVGISVGGSLASSVLFYNGFWYGYSIVAAAYLVWSVYSGIDAYNVAKEQGFTLGMTGDELTLSYNF
ncbi:MAG TPA: hypothetical protein ENH11_08935 [Candidatus Acetothermia bacterium]|nr:hypothetical protein [Candidatus Acetothermia bacterium]